MAEIETFQGFFSYARHDADADPKLIETLTTRLEKRVSGKLTNARLKIWRDVNQLRTGERWDERIGEALRASHVFIVLMTPKWFESAYCRKEYQIFLEIERGFGGGEYVVPLLARAVDRQIVNFDAAQKTAYDSLKERQYSETIDKKFLSMKKDQRDALVDKIADDIEGMIERFRVKTASPDTDGRAALARRANRSYEYNGNAHNAVRVDFVSAAEILVEPRNGDAPRGVFVDLGFIERMYVEAKGVRIEFSIRRAFLSIDYRGSGKLTRNPEWVRYAGSRNVYYVNYDSDRAHSAPQAVTVCIDPPPDQRGVSALPLPPATGENHLSKPALVAPDADISLFHAELKVTLDREGLFIVGEDVRKPSAKFRDKIAAITGVYAGKACRSVPVRERDL